MKVFILTPEKTIYEGEAIILRFTSINVSFQLLDHHTSMITTLKKIKLQLDKSLYHINNGILEVKNGMVKILVN